MQPVKYLLSGALAIFTAATPTALQTIHAENNYLTLSSYSGNPGSTIQVMGYGFMPNESIYLADEGMNTTTMSDSNGNFTSSLTIPASQAGESIITASGEGDSSSVSYYINGYYPTAQPSSYYLLPGQMISFSGNNFWPGEPVNLLLNGDIVTSTTANGGTISLPNAYTVPYSDANSSLNFQLIGASSMMNIPITVTIGTFYPQINPQTYYIGLNQQLSIIGTGFAPNEQVMLTTGSMDMTVTADSSGSFSTNLTAPNNSGNFSITATGQWSMASSQRTLTAYTM